MSDLMRRSGKIQVFTPVVTASSAYSANNCVGTLFELPGAVLEGGSMVKVQSIFGISLSKADPALVLLLFGSKPTGTFTDKTACNPSAADLALLQAKIAFGSAWLDFANNSASSDKDIDVLAQVTASANFKQSLWGLLVTTGTPTFGSVADLTVKIGLEHY